MRSPCSKTYFGWRHTVFVLSTLPLFLGCSASKKPDGLAGMPDPLAAGWQGEAVCEELKDDSTNRILRCTFAPGIGHERHFHEAHFGYVVVGGTMRITDAEGTRDVDLAAHTAWESDGVEWHEVVNVGATTAVFLIIEPAK